MERLKCFMWITLIHNARQQREEGSDVNYSKITKNSTMRNASYSVKPCPNNCACHSREGEIYNLAPLQNTDGTARFATNSVLLINSR